MAAGCLPRNGPSVRDRSESGPDRLVAVKRMPARVPPNNHACGPAVRRPRTGYFAEVLHWDGKSSAPRGTTAARQARHYE